MPRGPWIMEQCWNDLLFAHWRVDKEQLEPLIPAGVSIETFDSSAWIAVVPFKMQRVGFRGSPIKSDFLELNVRTYVKFQNISAVYFFSLDANNFAAVEVARLWFGLPYLHATMTSSFEDGWTVYKSKRADKRGAEAMLDVKYRPAGERIDVAKGSLEEFLTERYCLIAQKGKKILRGDIHHRKWSLLPAEALFSSNSMLSSLNIEVGDSPLLHYSKSIETVEWAPVVLKNQ